MERLGNLHYIVSVDGKYLKRLINQLRPSYLDTSMDSIKITENDELDISLSYILNIDQLKSIPTPEEPGAVVSSEANVQELQPHYSGSQTNFSMYARPLPASM